MRKLLCVLCAVFMCGAAWAETQFKIITLRHRFAQDLLPAVQPLVGEDGSVSAIDNHLLVEASAERMAAIEQIVATLDTERKTLRIEISRSRTSRDVSRQAGVAGSIRRGDVGIVLPRPDGRVVEGVAVDLDRREHAVNERASEFVSVLEGARAVIGVGQSVPFTEQWLVLTRRYVRLQQTVQYHDISTGFSVLPQRIGNEIELVVAPRIAHLAGDGVIDFQELATTVRLTPGQWFDLGGAMQSHDDVSRAILAHGARHGEEGSQLWVLVE